MVVCIQPIRYGLITPEILPTELASAMPAAAAAPPRIAGGTAQNCEMVVMTPMVPAVKAIMASTVLLA
ncbi:hypothetical protein FQZ97_716020 [compost metagenome]